jgi:4'-phosphopantetheinyl transferase
MHLPATELHVWFAAIDVSPAVADLLAPDEAERAARYHYEADRMRSTAARGVLRALLGRYLDADPRQLAFVQGEHGKPALADDGIEINASHSGDLVALAFARGVSVGVDVERLRPMRDAAALARRFFSPEEVERVESADNVEDAFFTIWTAKESVVKALGKGLGADLRSFTVPRPSPALAEVTGMSRWSVAAITPPRDGYRAAVAIASGREWRIVVKEFA